MQDNLLSHVFKSAFYSFHWLGKKCILSIRKSLHLRFLFLRGNFISHIFNETSVLDEDFCKQEVEYLVS